MVHQTYFDGSDFSSSLSCSSSCSSVAKSAMKKKKNKSPQQDLKCQFALKQTQVYPVERLRDLHEADIRRLWYCEKDFQATRSSIVPVVEKFQHGRHVGETDLQAMRGLECFTEMGRELRNASRKASMEAVQNEIDRQLKSCDNSSCTSGTSRVSSLDDELVRKAYKESSEHCQVIAHARALDDQEAASDYYRQDVIPTNPVKSTKSSKHQGIHKLLQNVIPRAGGSSENRNKRGGKDSLDPNLVGSFDDLYVAETKMIKSRASSAASETVNTKCTKSAGNKNKGNKGKADKKNKSKRTGGLDPRLESCFDELCSFRGVSTSEIRL